MHNKVVHTLARAFVSGNIATLRFNFRGVGSSEGQYDDGRGEVDDVLAAVDWMAARRPGLPVWLGGFSFGAYIATRAALNLDVGQLITIAPPVDRYAFDSLHHPECPWLVVQGDEDELVSIEAVLGWAEQLEPQPELVIRNNFV